MRKLVISIIFTIFLFCNSSYLYASISNEGNLIYEQHVNITDEQLEKLAIEYKIIPTNHDKEYFENEIQNKNTLTIWICMNREDKIAIIDSVKEIFQRDDNAVIERSSSYYVNEINRVIYNSITKGDITSSRKKGIGTMLKTIAIMDGDYNNGKNKVDLARAQMGQEYFEEFKIAYPKKYQNLLK